MIKKHMIIPIFVPHKGCPFDCVFCNQNKISNTIKDITADEVDLKIKEYTSLLKDIDNTHIEVAFYGGSFTGIEINKQKELLGIAKDWYDRGIIKDIRISTRPDYIDNDILSNLKEYKVSIIELGVQSMDDDILKQSYRGHTSKDVEKASQLIKREGFKLGLQMMIGLPGDTYEKSIYTAKRIISLSPDFVRIYPTLVIKDTYLEKMYTSGIYKPLSLEEGIKLTKDLYKLFNKNNIDIIRIGLQPTENINMGKDVIAGPFHPSIRQLVESEIYKEEIEGFLSKLEGQISSLTIEINPKDISKLVGHKKGNFNFFKDKFKINKIDIQKNECLKPNTLIIILNNQRFVLSPIH